MYPFYENIKKEIDLQDLVQYLADPLSRLKLLQIKIEDYKRQKKTVIEIEEIARDCKKISEDLFPDLINNYGKLSLEFRNKVVIKEIKSSEGEIFKLTSKDLLLKNCAKLIEHIQLMEEKFYKHFSFDFLVNTRIISDLGFQETYLGDTYESVNLKNEYVFSQQDAKSIVEKELIKTIPQPIPVAPVRPSLRTNTATEPVKTQVSLAKNPNHPEKIEEKILEKKNDSNEIISQDKITQSSNGINLVEIILVLGFISMATIGVFATYSKIHEKQLINQESKEQMIVQKENTPSVIPFEQPNTTQILKELAANNEKNFIRYREGIENPYKQTSILMGKVIEWKNLTNQNGIKNQEINYTNLLTSGFTLKEGQILASPRDMIYESKAYHIDVVTDKAQVKISNVFKDECQYMGVKFGSQYDIKVNDKDMTKDNIKTVCELNNQITVLEK